MDVRNRTISRLALGCALAAMVGGCGKEVPNGPAAGGTTLCVRYYARCVDPVFHQPLGGSGLSCSGQGFGCHVRVDQPNGTTLEGAGGRFKVYRNPIDDSQLLKNYLSALSMAAGGNNALLLTKPLADSVSHGGGDILPNTADPTYVRIQFWIQNSVDDKGDLDQTKDTVNCQALFMGPLNDQCRS